MSRSYDEAEDDYERDILDNVEEHGWFCPYIFDPKGDKPDFAYTVGFTQTLNCPEFIVFGLGQKLMHSMLWKIFRQIEAGKVPEDNQRWADLISGYDCISRSVHPTNIVRDYFNSAMWFWGTPEEKEPLKAFQIVWPGNGSGLFPWEDNCPQIVRDTQPALYVPHRSLS